MSARYALYYAPAPASDLAALGRAWLGRDAETGTALPPPPWAGAWAADWAALTAEPRRYGFHATLKPPFRLAPGRDPAALHRAVEALAEATPGVRVDGLAVAALDGFLALVPAAPCPALGTLADRCVAALDAFRAPPGPAELARRQAAPLTPRQQSHLARWGYPYVFDDYRFHMTLTGRLAAPERQEALRRLLADRFAPALRGPVPVDSLCLFVQPAAEAPFTIARRLPLGRERT